jgi:hypothetical protein
MLHYVIVMQSALYKNNTINDQEGDNLKRTPEKIVHDIKRNKLPKEKRNYTFRLNIELMDKLVEKCDKKNVTQTEVLTELIKDFISN